MFPWSPSSSSLTSSSFAYKEVYENQVMTMVDVREQQVRRERIMAAEEVMQRRQLGGWMSLSSSVMLRPELVSLAGYENRFINDNVYGKSSYGIMPLPKIYSHGGGSDRREGVIDDEVPFQRAPAFREMPVYPSNDAMRKPCDNASSSKRKEPPALSRAAGSIGFCLDNTTTKKKLKGEWSCDVCKISATSENGLKEHNAGKKHQAKMAEHDNTEGLTKSSVKEQSMEVAVIPKETMAKRPETTSAKQTFKTWCKICKVKTTSEESMRKHKQGKQHLKKLLSRERAKNKTLRLDHKSSNGTYNRDD